MSTKPLNMAAQALGVLGTCLALSAPVPAVAQVYGGVSSTVANWHMDCGGGSCDRSTTSFKVFGGYQINPYVAAEAAYVRFGTSRFGRGPLNNSTDFDASGVELAGRVRMPLGSRAGVSGKLGVSAISSESSSGDRNTVQPLVGVGFDYSLAKHVTGRVDWEARKVDLAGDKGTVSNWGVGVQFHF